MFGSIDDCNIGEQTPEYEEFCRPTPPPTKYITEGKKLRLSSFFSQKDLGGVDENILHQQLKEANRKQQQDSEATLTLRERNKRLLALLQDLIERSDIESIELIQTFIENDHPSLQKGFQIMTEHQFPGKFKYKTS